MKPLAPTIAVDFDGTLADHAFPGIGEEVDQAFFWLHFWKGHGANLILFTRRGGKHLDVAVEWCRERGIEFDAINGDVEEVRAAEEAGVLAEDGADADGAQWSAKPYYHVLIDDRNAMAPLKGGCVDWSIVGEAVTQKLGKRLGVLE